MLDTELQPGDICRLSPCVITSMVNHDVIGLLVSNGYDMVARTIQVYYALFDGKLKGPFFTKELEIIQL